MVLRYFRIDKFFLFATWKIGLTCALKLRNFGLHYFRFTPCSDYIKEHCEIVAEATCQHEQMPDTMKMAHSLIQRVKKHANGIKYSTQ